MNPDRILQFPPAIAALPGGVFQPKWSVMIPAYNCAAYLTDTLKSVLAQDKGSENMQIEVVDDCSTDGDIEKIVNELGNGRVKFFRQNTNVGSLKNFETCLNRANGKWIHLLHGDDMVKPGFYDQIEKLFTDYPSSAAAFTGFTAIDDHGKELFDNQILQDEPGLVNDWLLKIAERQRLQTCAMVVKRKVYEELGGFFGVEYGEDWEMWARIAAKYPVAYSPRNLVQYRIHNNNISSKFSTSGQDIEDIKTVIKTIQNYLPDAQKQKIRRLSEKHYAIHFAGKAQEIFKKNGNAKMAIKLARRALSLDKNNTTITSLIKLYLKVLTGYGKFR